MDMQNACPLHLVWGCQTCCKDLQQLLVYLPSHSACDKGNQEGTVENFKKTSTSAKLYWVLKAFLRYICSKITDPHYSGILLHMLVMGLTLTFFFLNIISYRHNLNIYWSRTVRVNLWTPALCQQINIFN